MTEMTKTTAGWILIDSACGLCRQLAWRWRRPLRRLGYRVAPLELAARAGLIPSTGRPDAMCLIDRRERRPRYGAEALAALLRRHPLTWWLGSLMTAPGLAALAARAYAAVAARRHSCRLEGP